MADMYGLEKGDSRIVLLEFLEKFSSPDALKQYSKLPEDVLKEIVKDVGIADLRPTQPMKKLCIAEPANALASLPDLLDPNPSLQQFDTYKNRVRSMLIAFYDTPIEQAALLMKYRLSPEIREQLELKSHIMIDVPFEAPKRAEELMTLPYRAHGDADAASLPTYLAGKDEKKWSTKTRAIRMVDCPAAILDWLVAQYAVIEDDRVAEYLKVLMSVDFESTGSISSLMEELETAVRKINELTQGKCDMFEWKKGTILTEFLMLKLPTSTQSALNSYLFSDGSREWGTIRKRAQEYASRQRIDRLAQHGPGTIQSAMAATGRGRHGGKREGKKEVQQVSDNERGSTGSGGRGGRWPPSPTWYPGDARYDSWVKDKVCFRCDETGHLAHHCPQQRSDKEPRAAAAFATAVLMSPRGREVPVKPNSISSRSSSSMTSTHSAGPTVGGRGTRRASWGEGEEGKWLVQARRGRAPHPAPG
jgi:hypothetical protein